MAAKGFSRPLLVAASLAVVCAWNYGFSLGSMNTASEAMRRSLGIASNLPENDIAWGLYAKISSDQLRSACLTWQLRLRLFTEAACLTWRA